MTTNVNISADPTWGFSPISRRYVKRSGAVWKRLVKGGVVNDPEVAAQLSTSRLAEAWATVKGLPPRSNNVAIPEPDVRVSRGDAVAARKQTKKLIAAHVDELEGMPPEQVDALLRRLLAMKMNESPAAEKVAAPALRVKVAATRKPPAGRKLRVADLFSTTEAETTAASESD